MVVGVYGLVDGPARWRRTLKSYVTQELGYKQSRIDPTVFSRYVDGELQGVLVIEIDDVLSFGYREHELRMARLQSRFKFGKYKKLQELESGTMFNGRRIQQERDGAIRVGMAKFIEERLRFIAIPKGRRSQPESDADATAQEVSTARGAIGSLAWLAKEGRPHLAGAASMLASKLTTLKVKDMLDITRSIASAKASRDLELRFHPIPPESLCWGGVTDESQGRAKEPRR